MKYLLTVLVLLLVGFNAFAAPIVPDPIAAVDAPGAKSCDNVTCTTAEGYDFEPTGYGCESLPKTKCKGLKEYQCENKETVVETGTRCNKSCTWQDGACVAK